MALGKEAVVLKQVVITSYSVGRKNNVDVSWDPQDVKLIYAFMCITDGVSECLCWTLFSPTLASQSRRTNHSSKHPAQDWGHSPSAHQQDPQSVWTQMRNTWVMERSSRDTFSFRQKVWLLAMCESLTPRKHGSGGTRRVISEDLFPIDTDYESNKWRPFKVNCIISAFWMKMFLFCICSGQVWVFQCWRQCQGQNQLADGGGRWESWHPQAWRHHHRAHLWKHW